MEALWSIPPIAMLPFEVQHVHDEIMCDKLKGVIITPNCDPSPPVTQVTCA